MTAWPGFDVRREERADATWLLVAGELDLSQARRLEADIAQTAHSAPALVVDLTGVTFCDSSGLAALLRAQRSHEALRYVPGGAVLHVAELGCVTEALFGSAPAQADLAGEDTVPR